MDNDDKPIGRILTRREILKLAALSGGAALLASCAPAPQSTSGGAAASATATEASSGSSAGDSPAAATSTTAAASDVLPTCVVMPELTEGPYFVDEKLNRSDIRSDPSDGSVVDGIPLELSFYVSKVGSGCTPLEGAQVDIWHCDVNGVYSDASDPSFNTKGRMFLRGYQNTDANGMAHFTTIYPGWYPGRTVHIHFKIRTAEGYDFTSQLFFNDDFTDAVYTLPPYNTRGARSPRNNGDGIFNQALILDVNGDKNGYTTRFDIGLQI